MAPTKYLDSTNYASIKVKAANVYVADTFVPCGLSEANVANAATGAFRVDGADLVVTTEAGALVPREIAAFDRVAGTFQIWFRDPIQDPVLGGTQLYLQWGGASVNVANDVTVWSSNYGGSINHALVVHGEEAGANLTDASGNYTSTDSNMAYNQTGKIDGAPECNGNNSISNWGNVSELNSATAVTFMGWINQDVANIPDFLMDKGASNNRINIQTFNDARLYFFASKAVAIYGYVTSYSTNFPAGSFSLLSIVYDGSQAVANDRAKFMANNGTLSNFSGYSGVMPTSLANFGASNYVLGGQTAATSSWDGKYDEWRIVIGALSENQIKGQYDNQNGFATNATITIGGATPFTTITHQSHTAIHNGIAIM